MTRSYGIHWFRRDLRVENNPALHWNWKQNEGRVVGLFFFDSSFLSRPDFSHARFAFFLDTLDALREELRHAGSDLLLLDALPQEGFPRLITALEKTKKGKPSVVTWNRDYEPFARTRDATVTTLLERTSGVATHTERDHLLIEPGELKKEGALNSFYQVYTPFARKWFELLKSPDFQARLPKKTIPTEFKLTWKQLFSEAPKDEFRDQLEKFKKENKRHVSIPIPAAGAKAAKHALSEFKSKLSAYEAQRDLPSVAGTSRLSIFLKNGSITTSQVIAELKLQNTGFNEKSGATRFLKELVWREFYYHILYHCPRVEKEAFLQKFKNIPWENREDLFEAWKQGRTGYPIVDAGMRELNQTGWMHNRVRMIVASFLTKDLLIDWRWGERYFMEKLLDGDLAPNNGGWQWAASTGCDPQPYFRIFNPTLQSLRFDPEGEYIKQYLPERRHLSGKAIHEPIDPVVEHSQRKIKALALYQEAARKH